MDWHDIAKHKVDELREMAKEIPGISAVTGLSKEELVEKVAAHHGIERPHRVVTGIDKGQIKSEIRALKKKRDEVMAAGDRKQLAQVRKKIRDRKRQLRRAAHLTH